MKITKGGLKLFAQCVVMERPLMAQSGHRQETYLGYVPLADSCTAANRASIQLAR
jgi:hypothetical protein